ncbi:MAG: murein L,D-transpeptidase [Rhodospirillaceae bacterium]
MASSGFRSSLFSGFFPRRVLSVLVLLALSHPMSVGAAEQPAPTNAELSRVISQSAASDVERRELTAIYDSAGRRLLWTARHRRFALLRFVIGLEAHGIDVRQIGPLPGDQPAEAVDEDVAATRAVLRASHIMAGDAIDASAIPGWHLPRSTLNAARAITNAVRQEKLGALLDSLAPAAAGYDRLRSAYLQYRRMSSESWPQIDPSGPRIVESGDPRMAAIRARLVILGDLAGDDESDQTFVTGVQRFQERHGLEPDGLIGPATLAQLNVSPASRASQIAINLDYWRLLPREWPTRYVAVNAAAAHLDVIQDNKVSFTTRVIVGDPGHPTPLMKSVITAVTFNPPWNVPFSIATREMLPRLRRDGSYLERSNIEIVGRPDDPFGSKVDWNLYSRSNFPFSLRQIPGPGNALGLVKFEMPNSFDVYLHDTPDRSLFEKNARSLSHGCVRVQCAQELAEHLLDDPAIWLTTDLRLALEMGRTLQMRLKAPVPVYLLYFTAFVGEDGTVHFRPDVYGRDRGLRQSLPASAAVSGASGLKGS